MLNLALSDILVATLVTPVALVYQLNGEWFFTQLLCDLWISVDITCCTASIANLCAISYDRYNAIKSPLQYERKRTLSRACIFIIVVWLYSVCIALPPFFGWGTVAESVTKENISTSDSATYECSISNDVRYTIYSTLGAFYLPLLIMLFAYICIYLETRKRTKQWKTGPGTSKIIQQSENRQNTLNLHLVTLDGKNAKEQHSDEIENECDILTVPQANNSKINAIHSVRIGSGSGFYLKNASLAARHLPPNENAIIEVDENTRREGSSSNGGSSGQGAALVSAVSTSSAAPRSKEECSVSKNVAQREEIGEAAERQAVSYNPPTVRRRNIASSLRRKLIRQVSNLPSHDSSATTSSSSANTASSSDLPFEHLTCNRRLSYSLLSRQSTMKSIGEKQKSLSSEALQQIRPTKDSSVPKSEDESIESCLQITKNDKKEWFARSLSGTRKSVTFAATSIDVLKSVEEDGTHLTTGIKRVNVDGSKQRYANTSFILEQQADNLISMYRNNYTNGNRRHIACGKYKPSYQSNNRRKRAHASQENRAGKTLSIIMGCFIVCWLPFFVVALVHPLCRQCRFPAELMSIVTWLGYCNSAINPAIYTFFNKDFRIAFKKVLHCSQARRFYTNSL